MQHVLGVDDQEYTHLLHERITEVIRTMRASIT